MSTDRIYIQLSNARNCEVAREAVSCPTDHPLWRSLTDRQREVLLGVIEGKPNKLIAAQLEIEVATVKLHLAAIFRKLGVINRTQAVTVALSAGFHAEAAAGTPER